MLVQLRAKWVNLELTHEARAHFFLTSLEGPIESVWLCGQVNDISQKVVFNHKEPNEIGWAGVTPADKQHHEPPPPTPPPPPPPPPPLRSPFSPVLFPFSSPPKPEEWRDLKRTWATSENTMARINRNQSYLQECTAGQIQPVAGAGRLLAAEEEEEELRASPRITNMCWLLFDRRRSVCLHSSTNTYIHINDGISRI